ARPKIRTVTKTVIKKVPVIKTVVKRIHVSPLPSRKEEKTKEKPKVKKKFKLFTFMKNIKKIKEPEFVK
ncbi:hypothetical protein HZC32_03505, partial [Candidatus Woesearchaeota archaeon]|nr:hypothetical protein [Candidatus Woesearchaeota archaeon]